NSTCGPTGLRFFQLPVSPRKLRARCCNVLGAESALRFVRNRLGRLQAPFGGRYGVLRCTHLRLRSPLAITGVIEFLLSADANRGQLFSSSEFTSGIGLIRARALQVSLCLRQFSFSDPIG